MKKLQLFALCLALIAAVSCSKDEPEPNKGGGNGGTTTVTHAYVDLGLPSGTLWADCNVGANAPEEIGKYFAWGETKTKTNFSWGTYALSSDGTWRGIYKYTKPDGQTGGSWFINNVFVGDNILTLEAKEDVATTLWSGDWRMPTREEMDELVAECTWEVNRENRVLGYKVTGPNGKYIFLPAAGYYKNETLTKEYDGCYWTSSLFRSDSYMAYGISIGFAEPITKTVSEFSRNYGLLVRPIFNGEVVSSVKLDKNYLILKKDETFTLKVTVLPSDASDKSVKWSSSNTLIATVDQNGKVTAVSDGSCTITCEAADGSGKKDICEVTVSSDKHAYVDLGLPSGTLWATCNIGADSPEAPGDHFAWGETKARTDFDAFNYKWQERDIYTKYCTNSNYGTVDGKSELELADDAAYVNWGKNWRMPSAAQWQELLDKCDWTTTEESGIATGFQVKSKKNSKSIYIPVAGIGDWQYYTAYWSRTLKTDDNEVAYCFYFTGDYHLTYANRRQGHSIRPVRAN